VLLMPLRCEPHFRHVSDLSQRLLQMVRKRCIAAFEPGFAAYAASESATLPVFAETLAKDYDAVQAALMEPWSMGPREAQSNRLRMVKRQMYGRAHFDFFRQRVLHAV
jgi:transposase